MHNSQGGSAAGWRVVATTRCTRSTSPEANRTSDDDLNRISLAESRILVTKDEDFVDSLLTRQEPFKLLLVATGNISNDELLALFDRNIAQLEQALATSTFVELSRDAIIVHF